MKILGAGMAGLIAANLLHRYNLLVLEKADNLPKNHAAVLRFRTDEISKATQIPFKKVHVSKSIYYDRKHYNESNLFFANMYSIKVTGRILTRSIINLNDCERYISPPDFIQQLSKGVEICFGVEIGNDLFNHRYPDKIISTLPMPLMMDMCGTSLAKRNFTSNPIWVASCTIDNPECDIYQTVYCPDKTKDWYRASITGSELIVEFITKPHDFHNMKSGQNDHDQQHHFINMLEKIFGIEVDMVSNMKFKEQPYGKIAPMNEEHRKEFIHHLTTEYGIYSLGRFATWRNLLLDDIVKDVNVIKQLIESDSTYDLAKANL